MDLEPVSRVSVEPVALSVSAYLAQLNRLLATQQGRIKGEVTTVKPYSKAIYFTIRDKNAEALLDCMIWVTTYQANGLKLKVGDEIIVTGSPDIYAPYGKFSFKTNTIEYAGEGAHKQAYDQLKATLAAEGLFAPERKRPIPEFPQRIGVITSMSGVVIHDFSTNLSRHGFKITTVDSRVEGKDAIHDLLAAIRTMSKQNIDVLVIIRGGGSWESLQPFNTESVVRAIAEFKTPVITGIGHDVDVTLSEMVADAGRSTPTAVAEALNEPWEGLRESVILLQNRTIGRYQLELNAKSRSIDNSSSSIAHSYERWLADVWERTIRADARIASIFSGLARRVREAYSTLFRATGIMRSAIHTKHSYLRSLPNILDRHMQSYIAEARRTLVANYKQVSGKEAASIKAAANSLATIEKRITLSDPRRTMRLGYSLSYVNGKLARTVADVSVGSVITTQLADGEFTSEVKEVE